MKIDGFDGSPLLGEVILPRGERPPIVLKIQALPIGSEERLARLFPIPSPPRVYAKNKAGAVLRDKQGTPIYEINVNDLEFQAASVRAHLLHRIFHAYHGLKADPRIHFETPTDGGAEDKEAFYESISKEFEASGLVFGDVDLISRAVLELSNFDARKVAEMRERFLSEAPSQAPA